MRAVRALATIAGGILGVVGLALALTSSCSSEAGPTDASSIDGRSDRHAFDGFADAPEANAALDAGLLEGWKHVPWLPEPACQVYQPGSKDALASVAPIQWVPCSSGRAGCRENAENWATGFPGASARPGEIGGALVVAFARTLTDNVVETVLIENDVVVWAFRMQYTGPTCLFTVAPFGRPGAVFASGATRLGGQIDKRFDVIGSIEEVRSAPVPTYTYTNAEAMIASDLYQGPANGTVVTYWVPPLETLSIRNRVSGAIDPLFVDAGRAMCSTVPVVQNDEVFFSARLGGISAWDPDGGLRPLRSGRIGVDAIVPHDVAVDNDRIVWVEGSNLDGGTFTESHAYLSKYSAHSSTLTPELLPFDNVCPATTCPVTIGDGFVAMDTWSKAGASDKVVRIVRVSDRAHWTLTRKGADLDVAAGAIVHGELWGDRIVSGKPTKVVRMDLSQLGSPE